MEQILERLFESAPKIRLLRLFVRNQDQLLTLEDIVRRSQVKGNSARRELKKLLLLGLIKQKTGKISPKGKKGKFYFTNTEFRLLPELQNLLTKDSVAPRRKLLAKAKSLGRIKLMVISGVFLNSDTARTDILLVGDKIKQGRLERFLAELESDLGRPLQYTLMSSEEFAYRVNMYDRFLRDILEFPHEKIINKLKI